MFDASDFELCSDASPERRSAVRTSTVFRPVLIETDGFAGFCLVRNLSETGMMGHIYTSFAEKQSVTLHFDPQLVVEGTLQWCREGRIGVRFDHPLDVDAVLARLARKADRGMISRAPRLQLVCSGELVIGDRSLSIEVQDVSQRGIKARASFIRPGDEVYVEIDGLERRKAVVRWTQDGTAGLNFIRPLSFEELARWVVEQQALRVLAQGAPARQARPNTV
jgi:hypothetical protein